jgi:xanthosine utilization system XapX-like protein
MSRFKQQLCSTRFVYVQEGMLIGIGAAFAKVAFPSFPIIELYGFVGPIISLAFGLKSWADIKETEARNGNQPKQDS